MATGEKDYLALNRKLVNLAKLREQVRKSNSVVNRLKAEKLALEITKDQLEAIGVLFGVENRRTDFAAPMVPACWDFDYHGGPAETPPSLAA